MNKEQFWHIIEDSKRDSKNNIEMQEYLVKKTLALLPPEEEIAYTHIFHEFYDQVHNENVWQELANLFDYVSDDSFDYFCAWLISCGKTVYYAVLHNTKLIKEFVMDGHEWIEGEFFLR